jgi:phosphoserine aminotransferase
MVEFPRVEVRLVADMSSEFLARPIEWNLYDLVYGGVQKNLAPAGMAVVYVRKSALANPGPELGSFLRYSWHAETRSLGHTPPMFSIYLMGKVLKRLQATGGIPALEARSAEKAALLYRTIDESGGFYRNPVEVKVRSHMNVVFRLVDEATEKAFLKEADALHMVGLRGHRSVGGCRASLYAALPLESVAALCQLMREFQATHG